MKKVKFKLRAGEFDECRYCIAPRICKSYTCIVSRYRKICPNFIDVSKIKDSILLHIVRNNND